MAKALKEQRKPKRSEIPLRSGEEFFRQFCKPFSTQEDANNWRDKISEFFVKQASKKDKSTDKSAEKPTTEKAADKIKSKTAKGEETKEVISIDSFIQNAPCMVCYQKIVLPTKSSPSDQIADMKSVQTND